MLINDAIERIEYDLSNYSRIKHGNYFLEKWRLRKLRKTIINVCYDIAEGKYEKPCWIQFCTTVKQEEKDRAKEKTW